MFTMPQKVRDIMGLGAEEGISDRELIEVIKIAQDEVKRQLFTYHYNEEIGENPDTGSLWDGSNTQYQTHSFPIMDITNNNSVSNSDVSCRWLTSSYTPSSASWTITNEGYANWGIVNIFQSDGATAIPSTAETVCIDYWSSHRSFSKRQLSDVTTYLAAHMVQHRLTSNTSISLADFQANRPIIMKSETQFYRDYVMLLHNLQDNCVKGV